MATAPSKMQLLLEMFGQNPTHPSGRDLRVIEISDPDRFEQNY
jgi:hypothetical protein